MRRRKTEDLIVWSAGYQKIKASLLHIVVTSNQTANIYLFLNSYETIIRFLVSEVCFCCVYFFIFQQFVHDRAVLFAKVAKLISLAYSFPVEFSKH